MIPLNKNQAYNNTNKNNEKTSQNFHKSNMQSNQNIVPIAEPEPHINTSSKAEGIIEYIFIKFSNSVRLIGPLFAFCLVIFVIAVANAAFRFIIPFWMKNFHFIFCLLYIIAFYLLFSVLFNYLLAVLVKPGSLADIKNSKFYRKNDPLRVSTNNINFDNSKLAQNLKNFYEDDKKKSDNTSSQIKIRYKTNENSLLNINQNDKNIIGRNINDNYKIHDDLKTLADLEKCQNSIETIESNFF